MKNIDLVLFLKNIGQILFWKMQDKFYRQIHIRFLFKKNSDFCFEKCKIDFFLKNR